MSLLLGLVAQGQLHAQLLPPPGVWTTTDIGAPSIHGASYEGACNSAVGCPVFVVSAGGEGVAGKADQFTLLNQRLTGDGVVTIRMVAVGSSAATPLAGLMIRESLKPGARHVSLLAGPGSTLAFSRRISTDGKPAQTNRSRPVGAVWLRLERAGKTFTASTSTNGSQWTVAGSVKVSMAPALFVGVAVTSQTPSKNTTATFSGISAVSTSPTLPKGWTAADLGSSPSPGASSFANNAFLVMSPGEGLGTDLDAFRFVYTRVKGDTNFVARVPEAQGPGERRVGIMFRAALTAEAAHSSVLADGAGVVTVRRTGAGLVATETRAAPTTGPLWLRLERRGSLVNAYHSADGIVWTYASSDTIPFAADFYVGLAVSAGLNVGPAAGAFDNVSLSAVAANRPPIVQITAPSPLRIYQPGAAVTITANASDPDDRLSKVDFFANGAKVGSDSAAPYSVTWSAGPVGPYVLTAVASDFDGASTTSLPVPVVSFGLPDPDPDPDPEDPPPSGPWRLQFEPSWGQETVDYYVMEIYLTSTRALVVSQDVGKPPVPPSGVCTVDIDSTVTQLPAGQYEVVLRAVDPTGTTPSSPAYFVR